MGPRGIRQYYRMSSSFTYLALAVSATTYARGSRIPKVLTFGSDPQVVHLAFVPLRFHHGAQPSVHPRTVLI